MQPEQLGPFRIGRSLGRGGMGAVYEGVHIETGETAAVKVLLSTLQEDDELRLRFEAEIDTLKRLRHPNIVRLFGFGEEQGMLYYVMELVNGASLHQEMKRQRLFQWYEVAKIGFEMCLAFKHAHDRGITHRDIKPANILLEQQGAIKLSDFGIAHFFGGHRFTEAHSVVGTLEYMSPEQALANPVGARSDLYSLGAVLYSLLMGRPPFTARNLPEILRKHQNGVIESIHSARLDVPDELELILFDLLKIRPEDRPPNAYLVLKRFQSLLQTFVGPPERIIVKLMEPDANITPSLSPVHIPYKGEQNEQILQPRGLIADTGVIDLGGIVDRVISDKPEQQDIVNIVETQPVPDGLKPVKNRKTENGGAGEIPSVDERLPAQNADAVSLINSFGRPGDLLNQDGQQTLEMPRSACAADKQAMTDSFFVSTPQSLLSTGLPEKLAMETYEKIIPLQQDGDHLPNEPSLNRSAEISPDISNIPKHLKICGMNETRKEVQKEDQKTVTPDSTSLTENFLFRSKIQHGEILFEEGREIRRAKDEPIPDINVFEAIQRNRQVNGNKKDFERNENDSSKTAEMSLSSFKRKENSSSTNDKLTVEELRADIVPGGILSILPPDRTDNKPKIISDQKTTFVPESVQKNIHKPAAPVAATVPGSKEKSITIVERPSSPSHFTTVRDEAFSEFESSEPHPIISLQTVLISLCLVLIGFTFYYLLQPVSADTQYKRIKRTIDEGNNGEEIQPSALRKAEDDINRFLSEHVQHPMADQIRFYQTELDLVKKEQELKRRQWFTGSVITNPVEQAYMEATALIKTDPEEAIIKLKAIISVFRSEKITDTSSKTPKTERINRPRHLRPPELCVELAMRHLEKLEKTIETTKAEQIKNIQGRLDKADELESTDSECAKAIRQGIIELYQNRRWAKEIVDELQQKIKE
jgi:serine/threonine protein kinase